MSDMRRMMMMFTRPVEGGGGGGDDPTPVLPYDAEVEYIQTLGDGSYIATGFTLRSVHTVEIKYGFDAITARSFPCGISSGGGTYTAIRATGTVEKFTPSISVVNGIHTFILSSSQYSIDGVNGGNVANMFNRAGKLFLFSYSATAITQSPMKVYYLKISSEGDLVFDCIPVRIGQVGYLYDKISGTLYGNSGSSTLAVGNDVTI